MLNRSQSAIVAETLRVSLAAAAADVDDVQLESLARAAAALAPAEVEAPHPAWPSVGASVVRDLTVGAQDTAAAMGHPDEAVQVLGSPRLALWFELVTCALLPDPSAELSHVGAGILVHHLGPALVGDTASVECTCASVSGRRAVFTCRASVGDRLVGLGAHHRALVAPPTRIGSH
jgi:predicted thioesterase